MGVWCGLPGVVRVLCLFVVQIWISCGRNELCQFVSQETEG